MKTMKQIVVAVSLVVISAMAPMVEAQQGVEKAAAGTLVAPAEALNSLLNMTESQMISLVKAFPADKYGFAPSAAIFAPGQQTEYAGVRTFGALVIHVAQANYILGSRLSGLKPDIDPTTLAKLSSKDEIVAALETSFAFDHKAIGLSRTQTPLKVWALELRRELPSRLRAAHRPHTSRCMLPMSTGRWWSTCA